MKPTLKAIFKDAILPSSFWEFLKLAIPGGIMMQVLNPPCVVLHQPVTSSTSP